MLKVCLIASNSLDVSPYVKKYINLLKENNIEFDVIEKRSQDDRTQPEGVYTYRYKTANNFIKRFFRFYDYASYVKKILSADKYDYVVLFSAINSSFCYIKLPHNLKKRYIVDIRDYDKAVENGLIRGMFKKVISNARMVIVSSEKFKSWLPYNKNTFIMHNLPNNQNNVQFSCAFQKDKIVIGYLGGIGYYNENVALVSTLQEKENVSFVYRGKYPDGYSIKNYCSDNSIKNVSFFGAYNDAEKAELYKEIDIINAVYGNDSLVVTTALPNKLYDCLYYKKPIMASSGTYLGDLVEKYNLGFAVDTKNNNIAKKLDEFVNKFDSHRFQSSCDELLRIVKDEQSRTEDCCLRLLKGYYYE